LDLGLVELRTGPRIGLGDYGGPTIHPYVIGNAMSLGGANYLNTLGGGVSLNWPVNETITITPGVEFRNRWFYNSENYPTASGQTGGQWIGYVFGSGLVSAPLGLSWQGRISFTDANASYQPYAFRDVSVDFGLPHSFAAPAFARTGSLWTLTPSVGFSYTPLIGDQIGVPSVAALIVEIVEIVHGRQPEGVPVRRFLKLGREQRVLTEREDVGTVGAGVGVGLVGEARLRVDRELVDRNRAIDRGDIALHFRANVVGQVLGGENRVEIASRHLVRMQMKIKLAELELHAGKVGVVVEHALERADRVLVVAEIGLEFGIAESGVEVVRFDEQAFEQEVGGDTFVLNVRWRGRPRRGRLSLGRFRRRRRLRDGRRGKDERRADDADRRSKSAAKTPRRRRRCRGPIARRRIDERDFI